MLVLPGRRLSDFLSLVIESHYRFLYNHLLPYTVTKKGGLMVGFLHPRVEKVVLWCTLTPQPDATLLNGGFSHLTQTMLRQGGLLHLIR
jgi:hypothetical protein